MSQPPDAHPMRDDPMPHEAVAVKEEADQHEFEVMEPISPQPKAVTGRQRPQLINPEEELTSQRAGQIAMKLALPAVAENFLMSLMGMVNMMMVGQIGPAAIAAVGATNQPIFFSTAVFQALNVGTTAVVARFFGAGEHKRANEAARQTLIMVTILSLIVSVIMFLLAEPVLLFMNCEPETMVFAVSYYQIVIVSLMFNMVTMAINAQVRGAGDTNTPMINNTVTNVLNVILNYVLINGYFGFPRLEVAGSAIATTISRIVGMMMALYVVSCGTNSITIPWREKFTFNWDLLKRVSAVGLPSMMEQLFMRGGNLIYTTVVSGLGTTTYAAHLVAMNISQISMAPGMGFGMAATTLVGQSLGAKRDDWAEACGWVTQKMSMILAIPMTLLFLFGGAFVAQFYSDDTEVIMLSAEVLKIVALTQIPQVSQLVLAGALRGAGDTKWPLISTFVGVWVFRVALGMILVRGLGWGLTGAWVALAIDQLARSAVVLYRYMTGKWKASRV